ncbi:MAG TPA: hypothetical protein VEF36_01340 [Roseiarcus sp.]|nr:hypothetical protein [Roseiarcus sp.]
MNIMETQDIETLIMRRIIADAIAAGYAISVHDGKETPIINSRDAEAIFAAMRTTAEDIVLFTLGGKPSGWVRLVYGNDGFDVVNDYTTNLDPVMAGADKLAEELEGAQSS